MAQPDPSLAYFTAPNKMETGSESSRCLSPLCYQHGMMIEASPRMTAMLLPYQAGPPVVGQALSLTRPVPARPVRLYSRHAATRPGPSVRRSPRQAESLTYDGSAPWPARVRRNPVTDLATSNHWITGPPAPRGRARCTRAGLPS